MRGERIALAMIISGFALAMYVAIVRTTGDRFGMLGHVALIAAVVLALLVAWLAARSWPSWAPVPKGPSRRKGRRQTHKRRAPWRGNEYAGTRLDYSYLAEGPVPDVPLTKREQRAAMRRTI